jgi:hypothetical protein
VLNHVRSEWLTRDALYSGVAQSVEIPPNVVNDQYSTAGPVCLPSCPDRLSPLFHMKQWLFSAWLKRSELEAQHTFVLWELKHEDNSNNFTPFNNKTTYKPIDCLVNSMAMLVLSIYEISIWFEADIRFLPFLQASALVGLSNQGYCVTLPIRTTSGQASVTMNCEISGLHRGVVEVFGLLRCYAGQLGRWIPKSATNLLHVTSHKSEGIDRRFIGSKLGRHTGCPNWGFRGFS